MDRCFIFCTSDNVQSIVVNGVKSDWAPLCQIVLGALFFSLHINDSIVSDIESKKYAEIRN